MTSLRQTSVSVMRPPKPPCWRDFVSSTAKSLPVDTADLPEPVGRDARSPILELAEPSRGTVSSQTTSKPAKLSRRPRAKIHRTRSEHVIDSQDLPESALTATLAEAEPKGMRARRQIPELEGRLYTEENNRRCQSWLASIEACEPLDEVNYTSDATSGSPRTSPTPSTSPDNPARTEEPSEANIGPLETTVKVSSPLSEKRVDNSVIPLQSFGEPGVDMEIPEETFVWDVAAQDLQTDSTSSGDDCCFSCTKSATSPRGGGEEKKKTTTGISLCFEILSDSRKSSGDTGKVSKGGGLRCCTSTEDTPKTGRVSREHVGSGRKWTSVKCCDTGADTGGRRPGDPSAGSTGLARTSRGGRSQGASTRQQLTKPASRQSSRNVLKDTDLWALDQCTSD